MQTIEQLLAENEILGALPPEHLEVIAGCATNEIHDPGSYLLREGEPEDVFYVIRRGAVALETFIPPRGAVAVQTLHDGDLLGWSWLIPPYRAAFDARALESTHVVRFDAACLRGKCEGDALLGYDLLRAFVPVVVQRLQATRLQLLDVYATAAGS